ncbi:MAG TPA: hypothetical protein PKC30_00255 [Saprospiraceae bacterium]|nr:hypothetical protein [Saprospiraceae bacterium]
MKLHFTYISVVIFLSGLSYTYAQNFRLPQVFMIGENEKEYESMVKNHPLPLIAVCDNSMERAFDQWENLMSEIENHANNAGFDLKGFKIWVNVFWDKEGVIRHIVFYPKPVSRLINYDEFTSFLRSFMTTYRMDIQAHAHYSHFGSMSFPVFRGGTKG